MNLDLYHKLIWVRFHNHFPEASEEEINAYFHLKEKEKIYCKYCQIELQLKSKYDFASPSIDHKQPLSRHGKNKFDNISICCYRCNIVKGTLTSEEYSWLLEALSLINDYKKEAILAGLFLGRKVNKIIRAKNQEIKDTHQYLHDFMEGNHDD